VQGDVNDGPALAKLLAGHDAVISAVMFHASDAATLIGAVKAAGVPRYLVVGGAGSLAVAPGVRLIDTPEFPDAYRAEAEAGIRFLDLLRAEEALNWTFLSPSAMFVPGARTGVFRLGTDDLLASDAGSSISHEDFAVAMIDELETPAHARARFTVGY
jgi:putative NADH-flavin reductase